MNLKDIKGLSKFFVLLLLIITMVIVLGKNVDFYYSEGVTAFNAGNYQRAEKYLKMALLLQPSLENTSNVKYMIGLSALYSGDLVTARAYLPSKDFLHTSNASINQVSRDNLLKDIAHWEVLSNPIDQEDSIKKERLPSWIGFLIFFSIFSITMLAFFLYKYKNIRKPFHVSITKTTEDETIPENIIFAKSTSANISEEPPSDMPSEEEIKARLESLISKNKDLQKEKAQVIDEPEKVIQSVNDDASDDELLDLTKAIQEILSKESENSRT